MGSNRGGGQVVLDLSQRELLLLQAGLKCLRQDLYGKNARVGEDCISDQRRGWMCEANFLEDRLKDCLRVLAQLD